MQITFNMFNFVQLCCHCVKSHLPKILIGLFFQEIQLEMAQFVVVVRTNCLS